MPSNSNLRIGIDARLTGGFAGGVAQFVIGLAYGLSQLTDGDEEYYFLVHHSAEDWLSPYVGNNCRILKSKPVLTRSIDWKQQVSQLPLLRKMWHKFATGGFSLPESDGTIEDAGLDLMHFTFQSAFLTNIPSIYHPHDLQHLHLPDLFTPRVKYFREFSYRTFCEQASMVAVVSSWIKEDVIKQYGLSADKVFVVPFAPATLAYAQPTTEELSNITAKYSLPQFFAFYPAQTWPHKNHITLLQAIALLRAEYGLSVPLVCSGHQFKDFHLKIEREITRLSLDEQIKFVGFVEPFELQALYKLSRCVVISTTFEAASFPLWEAFLAETPVACSNVTSLPEQAGDAALIFDPYNVRQIADALSQLWLNEELRIDLVKKGGKRVAQFSWKRTAEIFRAHYRRLSRTTLTDRDIELLNVPPLL